MGGGTPIGEILGESLAHVLSMLPLLFAAHVMAEMVSHGTLGRKMEAFRGLSWHPVAGALLASALGLVPQCGFATAATVMYLDGLIPRGTLIASYIATSDEALPVLLSMRGSLPWVLPLLAVKFLWGTACGVALNLAGRCRSFRPESKPEGSGNRGRQAVGQGGNKDQFHPGSGRTRDAFPLSGTCRRPAGSRKDLLLHALGRTVRVALVVLGLSSVLHALGHLGLGNLEPLLAGAGLWQDLVASLVGLFPSCATSVAIASAFQRRILSFSATVAGLSSNAGIALALLFKESRTKRDPLLVSALLALAGFVAGLVIHFLGIAR